MNLDARKIAAMTLCLFTTFYPSLSNAQPTGLQYEVVNSFSTLFDMSDRDPLRWAINSPDGLAWDGSGLWVSSCDSAVFAKFDVETGEVIDQFVLPDMEMADHLAWDGSYLWGVVHSMPDMPGPAEGRLIQIDTELHRIINTVEVPFRDADAMSPMGLGWDGEHLWVNDPRFGDVYRIDPVSGNGSDTPFFRAPLHLGRQLYPCGISWDGHSCLWVSDLHYGTYFQITPDTGDIVSFLVPPDNPDPTRYGAFRHASVTRLPTGMTTDGERVWVVDEIEGNPLVYELAVDFPTTGRCARPVANGDACSAEGQHFCGADSMCFGMNGSEEICHPRCDVEGQECAEGQVCGTQTGAPVCIAALMNGESCELDVDPPCSDDSVCYGEEGSEECHPRCDVEGQECGDGEVCGADSGEMVCVPGPVDGCECTAAAARGRGHQLPLFDLIVRSFTTRR